MPEFNQVTPEIRAKLEAIVGKDNVSSLKEDLDKHAIDESPLEPHPPTLVVTPANTMEVQGVLRLANSQLVPVTPQGCRTGLSGASHPIHGGIALSLEGMNKIIEIDEDNLMATVEPGVLINDIHEATEKLGLYYPPDPGQESGSIGGNISTNAGGMRAMKYGVTRDFVNGLEVVLPSGEVIQVGGKNVKDSTGYSLIDLIIGSEGTLGVVTKAILRLIPKPKLTSLIYAPFTSTMDAVKAVREIIKQKIVPFGLEYMPQHAVLMAEKHTGRKLPDNSHPAYLIVAVEANSKEELDRQLETAGEACIEMGAVDAYIADNERYEIRVTRATGSISRLIRRPGSERPVAPADIERYIEIRSVQYADDPRRGDVPDEPARAARARHDARVRQERAGRFRRLMASGGRIGQPVGAGVSGVAG